jgi:hypothetical protein
MTDVQREDYNNPGCLFSISETSKHLQIVSLDLANHRVVQYLNISNVTCYFEESSKLSRDLIGYLQLQPQSKGNGVQYKVTILTAMSLVEYLRYLIEKGKAMAIVDTILDNPVLQNNLTLGELY